mmetsp:Transcript_27953/g.76844  ORF Transcript_27953/g.76844 Transcript_27953/m.76844 type:complete len:281 (+) Transcript_27953:594-1436(+)
MGGSLWSRHQATANWGPCHALPRHSHRSVRTTQSDGASRTSASATASESPSSPGQHSGRQYSGKSPSCGAAGAPFSITMAAGRRSRTMRQKSPTVLGNGCCVAMYERGDGGRPGTVAALMYGTPIALASTRWLPRARLPVGRSKPLATSCGDQSGKDNGQRRLKCWCSAVESWRWRCTAFADSFVASDATARVNADSSVKVSISCVPSAVRWFTLDSSLRIKGRIGSSSLTRHGLPGDTASGHPSRFNCTSLLSKTQGGGKPSMPAASLTKAREPTNTAD